MRGEARPPARQGLASARRLAAGMDSGAEDLRLVEAMALGAAAGAAAGGGEDDLGEPSFELGADAAGMQASLDLSLATQGEVRGPRSPTCGGRVYVNVTQGARQGLRGSSVPVRRCGCGGWGTAQSQRS